MRCKREYVFPLLLIANSIVCCSIFGIVAVYGILHGLDTQWFAYMVSARRENHSK